MQHRLQSSVGQPIPPLAGRAPSPLGAAIAADLEALRNDVESARHLAMEYQNQLAGKSNEVANLKCVFEKAQADLTHLRSSIEEIRNERHRLANEAMRAEGLARKLQLVSEERDILAKELDWLRQKRNSENDACLARLKEEIQSLRKELSKQSCAPARPPKPEPDSEAAAVDSFIDIPFNEMPALPTITRLTDSSDSFGMRNRSRRLRG